MHLRRLAAATLVCLGFLGCKDKQLSGQDLQTLKREAIQSRKPGLTAEEEFRISGIRASTRSEFNRELERILEGAPR